VIVVADTSVFLNLCCIQREDLLSRLYAEVFAPPKVRDEFVSAVQRYSRFQGLAFPSWVRLQEPSQPLSALAPWARLDPGESAAIALATELGADLVLVDEAKGRAVARRLGLRCAGILAVLLDAKAQRTIAAVAPLIDELQQRAQFWLSQKTKAFVLREAGEGK